MAFETLCIVFLIGGGGLVIVFYLTGMHLHDPPLELVTHGPQHASLLLHR